jgi:hypothetical protein
MVTKFSDYVSRVNDKVSQTSLLNLLRIFFYEFCSCRHRFPPKALRSKGIKVMDNGAIDT